MIDQGDNYLGDGQNWPILQNTFVDPTGTNIGTIPFAINIGDGLGAINQKFVFSTTGAIAFLDASNNLTSSFIAPLLSPTGYQADSNSGSFMAYGAGIIDPQLLAPATANPVYNPADGLNAYRFLWRTVCPANAVCDFTNDISFEAIIVDRSAGNAVGDFDLDFFYDTANGAIPADASGGFLLGTNAATITGFSDPGPDFCFRGGVLASCSRTTTPVPEPETIALLFGGLAVMTGLRLRRRTKAA